MLDVFNFPLKNFVKNTNSHLSFVRILDRIRWRRRCRRRCRPFVVGLAAALLFITFGLLQRWSVIIAKTTRREEKKKKFIFSTLICSIWSQGCHSRPAIGRSGLSNCLIAWVVLSAMDEQLCSRWEILCWENVSKSSRDERLVSIDHHLIIGRWIVVAAGAGLKRSGEKMKGWGAKGNPSGNAIDRWWHTNVFYVYSIYEC